MNLVWGLPLALLLAGLALGPVVAHLVRRRPEVRRAFGAMMLLARMPQSLRRRRRVQDRVLLGLRMLAIAGVVLAVAQPELQWPGAVPELGGTGSVVVVLDNSLSMDLRQSGAGTLLGQARESAIDAVRELPPGTLVGGVTVGGTATRLTPSLTRDRGGVIAALRDVRQTPYRTDLVGAIREARRLLGGGGGEVLVYTDEAGPGVVAAALPELALLTEQGGALVPRPVRAERPANVAVVDARYGSGPEGGSVVVRVANYGPDAVEVPCTVHLPDGTAITAFIDVDSGVVAEELFTVPRVTVGGVGRAAIEDGTLAADDVFWFHLPTVGASRVLVVDGDPGLTPVASEVYFLDRALAPWGSAAAMQGGVLPEVTTSAGVHVLDPEEHRVVFLANLSDPGPLANQLIDFVHRGGGLVIGLGDNVTADRYNGVLASLLPSSLRRPRSLAAPGELGRATMLPDTAHPMFTAFARGGRKAFGRIRWSRLFTVEPYEDGESIRTLLRTEGGIPLLIEHTVGEGRVLLFTGTFDADWGNLPLQAAYMPWIQSLVRYLGVPTGDAGSRKNSRVGEITEVALPTTSSAVGVTGPEGPVPATIENGRIRFQAERAGPYRVETPGAPPLAVVAINVDPGESDVRVGPSLAETAAQVDPDRFMHRFPLHARLLWLVLVLGLIQGLIAIRRRASEPQEVRRAS